MNLNFELSIFEQSGTHLYWSAGQSMSHLQGVTRCMSEFKANILIRRFAVKKKIFVEMHFTNSAFVTQAWQRHILNTSSFTGFVRQPVSFELDHSSENTDRSVYGTGNPFQRKTPQSPQGRLSEGSVVVVRRKLSG